MEDKLKETSKLILLLFESSQESSNEELENKPVPLKLDIKDEEEENDSSIDSFYKVDKDMIDQELFADQSNQDISHYKYAVIFELLYFWFILVANFTLLWYL